MLREMGIEVESGTERIAPSPPTVDPRRAVRLRRGIPYTPQVFTPEEGGVPPGP